VRLSAADGAGRIAPADIVVGAAGQLAGRAVARATRAAATNAFGSGGQNCVTMFCEPESN
jgi:hypothetical protein